MRGIKLEASAHGEVIFLLSLFLIKPFNLMVDLWQPFSKDKVLALPSYCISFYFPILELFSTPSSSVSSSMDSGSLVKSGAWGKNTWKGLINARPRHGASICTSWPCPVLLQRLQSFFLLLLQEMYFIIYCGVWVLLNDSKFHRWYSCHGNVVSWTVLLHRLLGYEGWIYIST